MAQYKHKGDTLNRPAGTALTAGDVEKIVDSVTAGYIGVADVDIPASTDGSLAVVGVFSFKLKVGDVPTFGQLMYWDSALSEMSVTAGALCLAGRAEEIDGLDVLVKINVR